MIQLLMAVDQYVQKSIYVFYYYTYMGLYNIRIIQLMLRIILLEIW